MLILGVPMNILLSEKSTVGTRWIEKLIGIVRKEHGERHEGHALIRFSIGGANHGHRFTGGGQLTFHQGHIAGTKCPAKGIKIISLRSSKRHD
jgi:hypothetical protein